MTLPPSSRVRSLNVSQYLLLKPCVMAASLSNSTFTPEYFVPITNCSLKFPANEKNTGCGTCGERDGRIVKLKVPLGR